MTDESNLEETRPKTREEREIKRLETRVSRIAALKNRADLSDDVIAYVYHERRDDESRTTAGRIRAVLDDYEFGIRFGPGKFFVVYNFTDQEGRESSTSIHYSTGPEFLEPYRQYCAENSLPFVDRTTAQKPSGGGVLDLLDRGRVEALAGLAGLAKQVFNPGGGQEQLFAQNARLMEMLATRSNNPGLSDQIVIESIKSMRQPASAQAAALPPPSPREMMREQLDFLRDLQEVREVTQPKDEKEAGPMQFLIEKALEILPSILEKHNGNETAAAQALKQQNFFVRSMLQKPDVQKSFYRAAVENYGPESAARWARGFGIDPAKFSAQAAAPRQAQPTQPAARSGVMRL